jgi:pimeloyl-ACP methyl ester carboxylesterase
MERKLTIDGAEVYVKEAGAGVPVIMLHGSPDSGDMWQPLIKRLGDQVRSIAPDLPGFGRSTLPKDFRLTLEHYADFMVALLDGLGVHEPVHLISSDFGTHYAMALLAKYPDRVRGVVVSNSAFHRDYRWHGFARLYRVPLLGEFLLAGSTKDTIVKALKGFAPALPDEYIEASYPSGFGSRRVRQTILRMYRERNSSDFVGWDEKVQKLLKEKPSLVLWGDLDPFADKAFADKFGAQQVHHFPQYSHWLPLEAPDLYAEKLKAWLAAA